MNWAPGNESLHLLQLPFQHTRQTWKVQHWYPSLLKIFSYENICVSKQITRVWLKILQCKLFFFYHRLINLQVVQKKTTLSAIDIENPIIQNALVFRILVLPSTVLDKIIPGSIHIKLLTPSLFSVHQKDRLSIWNITSTWTKVVLLLNTHNVNNRVIQLFVYRV